MQVRNAGSYSESEVTLNMQDSAADEIIVNYTRKKMMVYSFRRPKPLHTISLSLYTDYCTLFPAATILQVICVARPPRYRQTCKTLRNVPPICL